MLKIDLVSGTRKESTKLSWPRSTDSRIPCLQRRSAAPYPRLPSHNIYVKAAGEDSAPTHPFFGSAHEGMGGVIVRDDLSGAFGGTR